MLCSLADGIGNLADCGITPERVVLIGGAARSAAVRSIAPAIFGVPVTVPDPAEYVAVGAARQAAWALSGADSPPDWAVRRRRRSPPTRAPISAIDTPHCGTTPRRGTRGKGTASELTE